MSFLLKAKDAITESAGKSVAKAISNTLGPADFSMLDARIITAMKGRSDGSKRLVMVAEIAQELGEQRRIVQTRLYTMASKGRIFRHEMGGDVTYHLEPREPLPDKKVPEIRHPARITGEVDEDDIPDRFTGAERAGIGIKILAAIDAKRRTLPQIKAHAGLEKSLDISDILTGMCVDHRIRQVDNGVVTAYFRYADKPLRFWVTGEGTVEAVFDETYKPRDEAKKAREMAGMAPVSTEINTPGQKNKRKQKEVDPERLESLAATLPNQTQIAEASEISVALLSLRMKDDPELRSRYEFGKARNPIFAKTTEPIAKAATIKTEPIVDAEQLVPRRSSAAGGTWARTLDLAEVERYSTECSTDKQIARRLGIGYSTFWAKRKTDPAVKAAYDRGRSKHDNVAANSMARRGGQINLCCEQTDLAEVERLAAATYSMAAAAEALGIKYDTFTWHIRGRAKDKRIHDAWQRGVKRRKENMKIEDNTEGEIVPEPNVAFEGPIDRFPSRIGMEIDRSLDLNKPAINHTGFPELSPSQPLGTKSGNRKVLALSNGGALAIGFDANFFNASPSERNLLNQIADLIQEHEEASA